jgi:hypothetical protein
MDMMMMMERFKSVDVTKHFYQQLESCLFYSLMDIIVIWASLTKCSGCPYIEFTQLIKQH